MHCLRLPLVSAICLLSAGCSTVPDTVYHPVCGAPPCSTVQLGEAVALREVFVERHGWKTSVEAGLDPQVWRPVSYYRAWLEYDGGTRRLFDPEQRHAVLRRLAEITASGQPVYVLVYVHGWHNNADDSERATGTNAAAFDMLMGRVVDQLERRHVLAGQGAMPQVLGIYVGWRGESVRWPALFKMLTIGGRARAADQLAAGPPGTEGGLRADLAQVAAAMRARPGGRMLVLGHSLGGRMLAGAFLGRFLQLGAAGSPRQPLGAGTGIVTLNAAIGADCFSTAYEPGAAASGPATPTWINVTSKDDVATRVGYPLGTRLRMIPSCVPGTAPARATIGHYAPYLTHVLAFTHIDPKRAREPAVAAALAANPPRVAGSFDLGSPPDQSFTMGYPMIDGGRATSRKMQYDMRSMDLYRARLSPANPAGFPAQLWNIQTDRNTIDFSERGGSTRALHNGFISTNLTRVLVDWSYALP